MSSETYLKYNFVSQQIKQNNNGISLKFPLEPFFSLQLQQLTLMIFNQFNV